MKRKEKKILFSLKEDVKLLSEFKSKGILDNAPIPPYIFPDEIPVVRHYEEDSLRSAYFPDDFSWKDFWAQLVDTFQILCDIAAKYNLTYQIHPASGVLTSTTDSFLYFFDAVKRDNLRFNLDTANLFAVKENLQLSLLKLKDHLDYIHVSDNRGLKVEHLEIGKGTIAWDKFFETLNKINFKGNIGVDIGGDESNVQSLDEAYVSAAQWLEKTWLKKN